MGEGGGRNKKKRKRRRIKQKQSKFNVLCHHQTRSVEVTLHFSDIYCSQLQEGGEENEALKRKERKRNKMFRRI
jgi:hypothetical protein